MIFWLSATPKMVETVICSINKMFLKPAENFEQHFFCNNGTHVIVLRAENELDAVEFQIPIFSTKGSEGKKLICIFIVCIEKQTKRSQDKAIKITHSKICITFTVIFYRKPWFKLVWQCLKCVLSASISGCLSSAQQLQFQFLLSFMCCHVSCLIVIPFCFPQSIIFLVTRLHIFVA